MSDARGARVAHARFADRRGTTATVTSRHDRRAAASPLTAIPARGDRTAAFAAAAFTVTAAERARPGAVSRAAEPRGRHVVIVAKVEHASAARERQRENERRAHTSTPGARTNAKQRIQGCQSLAPTLAPAQLGYGCRLATFRCHFYPIFARDDISHTRNRARGAVRSAQRRCRAEVFSRWSIFVEWTACTRASASLAFRRARAPRARSAPSPCGDRAPGVYRFRRSSWFLGR